MNSKDLVYETTVESVLVKGSRSGVGEVTVIKDLAPAADHVDSVFDRNANKAFIKAAAFFMGRSGDQPCSYARNSPQRQRRAIRVNGGVKRTAYEKAYDPALDAQEWWAKDPGRGDIQGDTI